MQNHPLPSSSHLRLLRRKKATGEKAKTHTLKRVSSEIGCHVQCADCHLANRRCPRGSPITKPHKNDCLETFSVKKVEKPTTIGVYRFSSRAIQEKKLNSSPVHFTRDNRQYNIKRTTRDKLEMNP